MSDRRILACVLLTLVGGSAPAWASAQEMGMESPIFTFVGMEKMELAPAGDFRPVAYEGHAWIGGDYSRLWLRVEGEHSLEGESERDFEAQALYSRLIAPFWDLQLGVRGDVHYGAAGTETRFHAVVGLEGLAPYWFELNPALFLSQDGDLAFRLDSSYDLVFTQRLVLEPQLELDVAITGEPAESFEARSNEMAIGARARYEIKRELAPYIGVEWRRVFGDAAESARSAGLGAGRTAFVAGVRWWY